MRTQSVDWMQDEGRPLGCHVRLDASGWNWAFNNIEFSSWNNRWRLPGSWTPQSSDEERDVPVCRCDACTCPGGSIFGARRGWTVADRMSWMTGLEESARGSQPRLFDRSWGSVAVITALDGIAHPDVGTDRTFVRQGMPT